MDPVVHTRQLTRPRFRRWTVVALVAVVLLLAHTTWDLLEARWLKEAMARWAPGYGQFVAPRTVPPDRDAAPYYRAAASLIAGSSDDLARTDTAVRRELAAGSLSRATLDQVGVLLSANADGLPLLDRATERDFAGFSTYRTANPSELMLARRLTSMRALHAAAGGDAAAAVRSLIAEMRLDTVQRTAVPDWFSVTSWLLSWGTSVTVADVQFVLTRVEPDAASLDRLAVALANADDEREFARFFTRARDLWADTYLNRLGGASYDGSFGSSGLLGAGGASFWNRLCRPLIARDLRWKLEVYATIIEAAKTPWPDRIDRVVSSRIPAGWLRHTIGERLAIYPGHPGWVEDAEPWWQTARLGIAAADLAGIRAARVAVTIERYRRAHQGQLPASLNELTPNLLTAIPIDPFSGQPMLLARDADGYVVYSVGPNRSDDRGDQAGARTVVDDPGRGPQPRMTGDIGVTDPYQPQITPCLRVD